MGILVDHPLTGAGVGIRKLSELEIDAAKNWQGKGITNIKQVVLTMAKGDEPVGGSVISLTPGAIGKPLTSQGPGSLPTWG